MKVSMKTGECKVKFEQPIIRSKNFCPPTSKDSIVASSMKAPEFLDCCERLAMDIKTGPDGNCAASYYDFASGRYAPYPAQTEDGGDGGIIACARC
ncbi:MAG: hypothetical protein ACLVJO_04440 [[Clostridium] scindens]